MSKFRVTMKDPDTLHDACKDAAAEQLESVKGIDGDERESLVDQRAQKLRDFCGQWFRYGEYLTVEIDTDAGTCVVVPASEAW
jgi:hypothetical protein